MRIYAAMRPVCPLRALHMPVNRYAIFGNPAICKPFCPSSRQNRDSPRPGLSRLPNLLKWFVAEQGDSLLLDNLTRFRRDHEVEIRLAPPGAVGVYGE